MLDEIILRPFIKITNHIDCSLGKTLGSGWASKENILPKKISIQTKDNPDTP